MIYWAIMDAAGKCVECHDQAGTPHTRRSMNLKLARYDSFGDRESQPAVQNYRRELYAKRLGIEAENDDIKTAEYQEKAIQAQMVIDAPNISADLVPLIALERDVNSTTLHIEAERVMEKVNAAKQTLRSRAENRIMKRMKSREILNNDA